MHPYRWLTDTLARVVARGRARRRPSAPMPAPTPGEAPRARELTPDEAPWPRPDFAAWQARLDEDVRRIAAATRLPPWLEPDAYLAAPVRDGRASWPDASPVAPVRPDTGPDDPWRFTRRPAPWPRLDEPRIQPGDLIRITTLEGTWTFQYGETDPSIATESATPVSEPEPPNQSETQEP